MLRGSDSVHEVERRRSYFVLRGSDSVHEVERRRSYFVLRGSDSVHEVERGSLTLCYEGLILCMRWKEALLLFVTRV